MRIFKGKKGFFQHPGYAFGFGVVAGLVLAYVWIKYINFPNPYV